ncbi:MAG: hypothetical protein AAF761_06020 [Pseudomonadota bacterium]
MTGPTHVLIHPGFHKTGTSSARAFWRQNRKIVRRHAEFLLKWRFEPLADAARAYSRTRRTLEREVFNFRLMDFLGDLPGDDARPLLLTCEEFSGHLPGAWGIEDYGAAADLLPDMVAGLRTRFRADLPVEVVFTTRERHAWLRSAWAHNVARSTETDDWDTYAARWQRAADLDAAVAGARAALTPHGVPVTALALEVVGAAPGGPGAAILRHLGLPERALARMEPVVRRNAALAPDALAECLRLNRQEKDKKRRTAAKEAILATARSEAGY